MVTVVSQSDYLQIEVLDQGPGIPEDKISIVSDKFIRMDESKIGYGIGLNIVKRIVQVHQGKLFFTNTSNGLKVTICLKKN
ncbi:hypothetical protein GKC56_01645 [Neisseriaceae bacterium PsAf]|nr:hypothetical protein [Neisseriaceae bacterium PsAf]